MAHQTSRQGSSPPRGAARANNVWQLQFDRPGYACNRTSPGLRPREYARSHMKSRRLRPYECTPAAVATLSYLPAQVRLGARATAERGKRHASRQPPPGSRKGLSLKDRTAAKGLEQARALCSLSHSSIAFPCPSLRPVAPLLPLLASAGAASRLHGVTLRLDLRLHLCLGGGWREAAA